ncbi:MAG: hypothetical protein BWK79_00365 [Beggiatoa sp. IS2]|nr:MAG: hypothetical protein BWK79_00365 [Beggiatoa sp. IS2]
MRTPFDILGVGDDATDEIIKKAYLHKVRQYPPEREPEEFQKVRAAFEQIKDQRQRLRYQLFHHDPPGLDSLWQHPLLQSGQSQRPDETLIQQALAESLTRDNGAQDG